MDPFIGEIMMAGFNFAPRGWALCNGQTLAISQNTALFSLLGTNYGGNGTTTFALPDLRGRTPIQQGQGPGLSSRQVGETGGVENVTLISTEIPSHTHALKATTASATTAAPAGAIWAVSGSRRSTTNLYTNAAGAGAVMNSQVLAPVGSSVPHNNMPPYLAVNFCIALQGIFPARN